MFLKTRKRASLMKFKVINRTRKWALIASAFRFKAGLHNGDRRSKLVHFKEQKNIFYVEKSPSLERFSPECKHHFKQKLPSEQSKLDRFIALIIKV